MATLPYWNNGEVISSDKLNSMVNAIISGDPLAVKVSNATKNDVNQIVDYLSSLHNKAKDGLNSATYTGDFDTAYTNMTALVSNKLGFHANDDTVDLYSTGIRASIIAFLQAYDNMMSNDRLNNKNTDNTLGSRIDSEIHDRENADNAINTKISAIQANGGGRNLLRYSTNDNGKFQPNLSRIDNYIIYAASTAYMTQGQQYIVHANASNGLAWSSTHNPSVESNNVVLWLVDNKGVNQIISDANTGTGTTFTWNRPSGTYYLRVNTYRVDNSGYADHVMLEKGIVAHDWSPAPEDTDAKIDALNNRTMQNRGTVNAPDFNSLTQAGYYTITNISQGNNYPTSSWGTLEVSGQVADVNGCLNQKYVSDNGGTVYTRQYNNDTKTWTAWVKIANQNDINSVKDLANSKANTADINWANVVANSSNTYNFASGSKITLPNNSSITVNGDRIISNIKLPSYFTDNISTTSLDIIGDAGEYDNVFVSSATMSTLTGRPTNPDTGASLTGDCFFTNHYAYAGTTLRAFQKIYSCDYNYTFTRSYNGSSQSWTNWSCLTPYA